LEAHEIKIIKTSSYYETVSWPDPSFPKFINAVLLIKTKLNQFELFKIIKSIEKKLGRKIAPQNHPRNCDIDILDFNGKITKSNKKFTLLSAFVTLLNDRLSESILLPILPSFVLLFDSKASTYGLLSCTYQLAQFTASPFIGLMSDRYGRRPVTLFCISGSAPSTLTAFA